MRGQGQTSDVRSQKSEGGSRWALAIVLLVTLATMGRLCTMDFSWWDDSPVLHHNPLMNPVRWETVRYYWTHEHMGLYVPVTYTVWAALAAIAHVDPPDERGISLNPWVFHTFNLALHLANVSLVYVILRRIIRTVWPAVAGALIFAVHPVQVETVAWIAGMKDLLCGTFVLLAVWQYLTFAQKQQDGQNSARSHYWLGLACLIIGTLCKPTAVVTPVLAATLDLWVVRRGWKQVARDLWPWIVAILPCLIWAKLVQTVLPRGPLWSRPLIATDAIAFYLGKLLWPAKLTIDYARNPAYVISTGQLWWTWLFPAGVATALWLVRRKAPLLIGAGLLFLGGLLPVLGLTPFMFQLLSTVADHYLYLPMLGVALAAAWVVWRWPTRWMGVTVALAATALAVRSAVATGVWTDDLTLFKHAVAMTPRSEAMHINYAAALKLQAEREKSRDAMNESIRQLHLALQCKPNSVTANENLAEWLIEQGRIDEGIQLLQKAMADADRDPLQVESAEKMGFSHHVMGAVLAKNGRYAEAVHEFERALDYLPGDKQILQGLENARRQLRQASTHPATTPSAP